MFGGCVGHCRQMAGMGTACAADPIQDVAVEEQVSRLIILCDPSKCATTGHCYSNVATALVKPFNALD